MRKLVALSLVAAAGLLSAQETATATATASVRIVAPVKITANGTSLQFGNIIVHDMTKAATVTMTGHGADGTVANPDLPPTFTNCSFFSRQPGNHSVAQFHYSADEWAAKADLTGISVAVVPSAMTRQSGSGSVTLEAISETPADLCMLTSADLNPRVAGVIFKHFGVGGKLTIEPSTVGAFTGTLTATISYI